MTVVINSGLDMSIFLDSEMHEKLSAIGCCKICSLRFCGETNMDNFRGLYSYIEEKRHSKPHSRLHPPKSGDTDGVYTDTENGLKIVASNACIACLGLLQPPMCDKITDKIIDAVSKEEYDNPTFNVAFTFPVSFYLRAHAVLVFLANNYPEHVKENLPLGLVTVGVKDTWKDIFADKIAKQINKTLNIESEFRIQTDIQYEDDHSEITCLLDMYPNKFKDQKIKAKKLRDLKGPTLLFSRKSVESLLMLEDREHFARYYPVPPPIPTHSAVCNNVLFHHSCIYIAGRYNKYVRELPQTAWMVQDQRKLETSVHELIGDKVEALTKAQGSKLISSGREDVDVRMLGIGRPFALELISPRHVVLSPQELKELEHQINSDPLGRMAVNQLKVVPKSSLEILKTGEEKKTKTYEAYCKAWGLDQSKLSGLAQLAPLTLQQKTPVRVLHRRPIATRPRTVHWLTVSDVKASADDNSTYFKLALNTQAGTYIKEFIHGDFGRTKPSVGDLLGGVTADCLALDVMSIELDWPPG